MKFLKLYKIPLFQLYRNFGFPKILPLSYTFLISTKCNSRCKTCNIWKQKHTELTLKEWKKVFLSLGKSPFWITVSGGEPFLQKHLSDFVIEIYKICQPEIINIPTNSLLAGQIEKVVIKILKKVKTTKLIINLSLDGVEKDHDRVRGVAGSFKKVMENFQNLKKLQKKYPNLSVGIHTVISSYNYKNLEKLFDLVLELKPDQYITEIAEERVELGTIGKAIAPSFKDYCQAIDLLERKMGEYKFKGVGKISRSFRAEYYLFVKRWLKKEKLLPDFAGFASCEITSWGEVWPSCIKGEKMGNVKDVNFDFSKVWFSKDANLVRGKIKKRGTSYPLANAFYTSSLLHFPTLFKVLKRLVIS